MSVQMVPVVSRWLAGVSLVASLLLLYGASIAAGSSGALPSTGPEVAYPPEAAYQQDGTVSVRGAVEAIRLLVVDDEGAILEIWSNSPGTPSVLLARLGSRNGSGVDVTPSLLSQYSALALSIDWSVLGRVY